MHLKAVAVKEISFPTLCRVSFRTWSSREKLYQVFEASGCRMSDWAHELFLKMPLVGLEATVALVAPTIAELGLSDRPSMQEAHWRGGIHGLTESHPQAAIELCITRPKEMKGRVLLFDMYPMSVERRSHRGQFFIDWRQERPRLDVYSPTHAGLVDESILNAKTQCVFTRSVP